MILRVITANLPVHEDKKYTWNATEALERVKAWATKDGELDDTQYEKAFLVRMESATVGVEYDGLLADVIEDELVAIPAAAEAVALDNLLEKDTEYYEKAQAVIKEYAGSAEAVETTPPPEPEDEPEPTGVVGEKQYTAAEITEKSGDGTFTAIASTAVEDRHGEIIDQSGWNLKNFKNNPVLLWAHDHTIPAIGTATKVWVKDGKLMFKGKWQDVTEMGRAAKKLVEEGIINSFSVGFLPTEMDGWTYTKQELLEISLVNVPANPEAMMLAYKSLKKSGFKKEVIKDLGIPVEVLDELTTLKKTVDDLSQKYDSIETLVKANIAPEAPAAPATSKTVTTRQSLVKTIAKASDKILQQEKQGSRKQDRVELVKVIKRAAQILSASHKEQLIHGKDR